MDVRYRLFLSEINRVPDTLSYSMSYDLNIEDVDEEGVVERAAALEAGAGVCGRGGMAEEVR